MVIIMSTNKYFISDAYLKLAKYCGSEEKFMELISNNVPINDHTNKEDSRFIGAVVFDNGDVSACFNTRYYSLNELYLDIDGDSKLHVGQCSNGNVLFGIPTPEKLAKYNEDSLFKKIVCAYLCDGTKVLPAKESVAC